MPGKLIWLVGPSGSGKDNLLAALHQHEHPRLLMAHRYITRPFSAGSENHIALSEREFFTRAEQRLFILSWHASNTYYDIGVKIDLWLHTGLDVIASGSHAYLTLARGRYGEVLVPVCPVISPPVLRQRLEQRGRENAPEIAQHLDRAVRYKPDSCLTLNNDGSLQQSVDDFFRLLRSHVARIGDRPI